MVYGLKDATPEFIESLKLRYPQGVHVTHKLNGSKLPHNGVFYSSVSKTLMSWADLKRNK